MKKPFLVQLHIHTWESSRCGQSSAKDMVRACKAAGYNMIVTTDHFFNANVRCDFSLPWPQQIDCLMAGYEAAKAEGDRIGVKVLFAWETNSGGPEVLTYGLGREFLLANPDVAKWPVNEYLDRCHAAGAFLCHAHPYREAWYIKPFEPQVEKYDAVEVFNYAHLPDHGDWNDRAYELAQIHGKLALAGCDAHSTDLIGGGAMALPYPVDTMEELIAALRSGDTRIIETL